MSHGWNAKRLSTRNSPHRKERGKDPTVTAAQTYAARIDAVNTQRVRIRDQETAPDPWGAAAALFRFDPLRELDANLDAIAAFVQPEDVLIDVGGGAGRVSLPLALRCCETITIEPSPGMKAVFESLAAEAGITTVIVVTSPGKEGIAEYFRPRPDLETRLADVMADGTRARFDRVRFGYVEGHRGQPLGCVLH